MQRITRLLTCGVVGLGLAATASHAAVTEHTYQEGVNGYTGNTDNWIDGVASHGDPHHGSHELIALRGGNRQSSADDHKTGEMYNGLIAFSNLGLTPGTQVQSATLTFTVSAFGSDFDDDNDAVLEMFELVRPWDEATSKWANASAGTPWGTAGAQQDNVDRGATLLDSVVVGNLTAPTTITFDIPAAVVQAWIDGTAGHHGLLLRMADDPFDSFQTNLHSSEAATLANRPKLTINVIPEPASLMLLMGGAGLTLMRRQAD